MQHDQRVDAILKLIADGRTDKEIASLLCVCVSVPTVRKHLQRFFLKHHLHSRTAAVLYWINANGRGPTPAATGTIPSGPPVHEGERLSIDGVAEHRLQQVEGPWVEDTDALHLPQLPLEPAAFRDAMGRFPTGVTIMTTVEGPHCHGMTASAFCSVSLKPLLVMVSVARGSLMHHLVSISRVFAISILGAEGEALGRFFADKNRCRETQFGGLSTARGITGCPILLQATVYLEATTRAFYDGGDHSLVLGEVVAMGVVTGDLPLVFYRGDYTSTARTGLEQEAWLRRPDTDLARLRPRHLAPA